MTLSELLEKIASSEKDDWHTMEYPTIYVWDWGEKREEGMGKLTPYLEPRVHSTLLVFKDDIDIS